MTSKARHNRGNAARRVARNQSLQGQVKPPFLYTFDFKLPTDRPGQERRQQHVPAHSLRGAMKSLPPEAMGLRLVRRARHG